MTRLTRVTFGKRLPSMPSRLLFEINGLRPPEGWVAAGQAPPQPKTIKCRKKASKAMAEGA